MFKGQTTTLPIVALTGDPIAAGLAQSLARPGGNITGVSVDTGPALNGKRVELLREFAPGMTKLAYLTLRAAWEGVSGAQMRAASEAIGIALLPLLLDTPTSESDYRGAIETAKREDADAIMIGDNPDAVQNRLAIVDTVARARLPAMYFLREFVESGGLMAYAFDLVELNRRVASDIDAILKGANPGEIPYFQSSRFELTLNLTTAKALGLAVPQSLLARADEVIE